MRRPLVLAFFLAALLQAQCARAIVDLLFRPVNSDLVNFGASDWNVRFRPTRDVQLTGLGLIFDPMPVNVRPRLSLGLWQDDVHSDDDRIATLAPVLDEDFVDSGLNRYVFQLADYPDFDTPRSIVLERSRPYFLTAQLNLDGRWPEQIAETQQFPFTTTSGSLTVLGGGRGLATMSGGEHPPLVVELDTQAAPISRWAIDSSGDWSVAANWSGGAPNGVSATAVFGGASTQPRHVLLHQSATVGRIDFNNANAYTIGGAGTLGLQSTSGEAEVNVVKGSHAIAVAIVLASDTVITVAPAAGNLSITALGPCGANLTKEGAGTLTVNNIRAAGLAVNRGTVMVAANAGAPGLGTSMVGALSIAGTPSTPAATFDLTNNAAAINYTGASPAATVRQQIVAGRGGAGLGHGWNGMGITSSAAAAANANDPESRSVGYADNVTLPLGPYTTFRGQAVDDTSILMAFTRTGDANLDGLVNDDDITIVGATYAPGVPQASWALGDFDYNGFVDDDDITLLGVFYDPSAAPLFTPAPANNFSVAAVPEPESLAFALVAVAATGAFILRRRARELTAWVSSRRAASIRYLLRPKTAG